MTPRDVLLAAVAAAELHEPGHPARNEPCVTAGLLLESLGPGALDHALEVVALLEQVENFESSPPSFAAIAGHLRLVK